MEHLYGFRFVLLLFLFCSYFCMLSSHLNSADDALEKPTFLNAPVNKHSFLVHTKRKSNFYSNRIVLLTLNAAKHRIVKHKIAFRNQRLTCGFIFLSCFCLFFTFLLPISNDLHVKSSNDLFFISFFLQKLMLIKWRTW